jgi:hypothetical protein
LPDARELVAMYEDRRYHESAYFRDARQGYRRQAPEVRIYRRAYYFTKPALARLLETSGFRIKRWRDDRAYLGRWLSEPAPRYLVAGGVDRVHDTYRTPHRAIIVQGIVAIGLVAVLRSFPSILDYTTFAIVLATMADTAALYALRSREPAMARPYRAWG